MIDNNLTSEQLIDYYKSQLAKITPNGLYPAKIKLTGLGEEKTNWLDLNAQSARELIEWLTKNYVS